VVVAEHGGRAVLRVRQVQPAGAQVLAGGQRRVEDVVRAHHAVFVAVGPVPGPRRRDELHGADRAVPASVAVQGAAVGVLDRREAAAVQDRAEDVRHRVALGVDAAVACVVGLDPADGGEQRPVESAVGRGRGEGVRGLHVGVEHDARDVEVPALRRRVTPEFQQAVGVVGAVEQVVADLVVLVHPAGRADRAGVAQTVQPAD
jgi:hypothetical protein